MHGHSCHHDHSHGGHHGHHHHPVVTESFGRRFAIGAALNMGFVIAELWAGYVTHSLALIADAIHNFSDVVGLLIAWAALWLAGLAPTAKRTYGYRSVSILAALANACILFGVTGAVVFEAIERAQSPTPVSTDIVIIVALVGIVVNVTTAMMFWSAQKHDINIRGAFLHMMGDAAVSLGVVAAAVVMRMTGWMWVDPAISVMIALVIIYTSWGLAMEALNMAIGAVPAHVDVKEVRAYLSGLPEVSEVHDLHIWAMSTSETALTAHLVCPKKEADDTFLNKVADHLRDNFGIQHATIQIEAGNTGQDCRLSSHSAA